MLLAFSIVSKASRDSLLSDSTSSGNAFRASILSLSTPTKRLRFGQKLESAVDQVVGERTFSETCKSGCPRLGSCAK